MISAVRGGWGRAPADRATGTARELCCRTLNPLIYRQLSDEGRSGDAGTDSRDLRVRSLSGGPEPDYNSTMQ